MSCLRNDHDSALISCPVEVIISPACQHVKIGKIVNVDSSSQPEASAITIVIKTLYWCLSPDSRRQFQNKSITLEIQCLLYLKFKHTFELGCSWLSVGFQIESLLRAFRTVVLNKMGVGEMGVRRDGTNPFSFWD